MAYIVDSRDHRQILATIFPMDKLRNSNRRRRTLHPATTVLPEPSSTVVEPVPPLMRKLLSDYAQSGLPPAYIPLESTHTKTTKDPEDPND